MPLRPAALPQLIGILGIIVLLLVVVGPVRAGSGGAITVRLVLRGEVPATDSFGVGGSTASGAVGIEPVYCGPQPNSGPDTPPCSPGAYEFAFEFEAGDAFEFAVYRCQAEVCDQTVYEATATVTESPQLFTVVYDYSLGSRPLLPDTAVFHTPSTEHAPAGLVSAIVVASLALVGCASRLRATFPALRR